MRLAALVVALVPLGGCAVTDLIVTLPQNDTCSMRAGSGLIDLGIAAVGAGIVYADNKTSVAGWTIDGVFVASALLGFARGAACNDRGHDDRRPGAVNINANQIPDSVKLAPPREDSAVPDATPEEMGIAPATKQPQLTVDPATVQPPAAEPGTSKEPPPTPAEEEHAKPLNEPADPFKKQRSE
ncbi:MAG TPA: hypothetical protein VGM39_17185 [Kofleriaceae bacterium]|jgi:hypothetical protein